MVGKSKNTGQPLSCQECQNGLQEYLDGTLEKKQSLRFFLHIRDCAACKVEHAQLQDLYSLLDNLPEQSVPEGFDQTILAAVPYEAYQEMAAIRAERVPVFLEEAFLPEIIRSSVTRTIGVGAAAVATGVFWMAGGPAFLPFISVVGLIPEILVRLQGVGRWAALTARRVES